MANIISEILLLALPLPHMVIIISICREGWECLSYFDHRVCAIKSSTSHLLYIIHAYLLTNDEQLLDIIRIIPADYYFRNEFSLWPHVLEAVGVKPVFRMKQKQRQVRKSRCKEIH